MGADPTAIPARLERGERADVVIMALSALDKLVAAGRVRTDGVTDLGLSRIAMAVKAGAPKPDIGTVTAFKRTLLAAKSIAYSDSASAACYLSTVLFKRLGVEKAVAAKSKMIQATPVGLNVARGEYEIGFQQLSELKPVPGIDIVGLIPESLQTVTPFSAGVTAAAAQRGGRLGILSCFYSQSGGLSCCDPQKRHGTGAEERLVQAQADCVAAGNSLPSFSRAAASSMRGSDSEDFCQNLPFPFFCSVRLSRPHRRSIVADQARMELERACALTARPMRPSPPAPSL